MAKHSVKVIPFDALVKVEIPGSFYARLQQLLISYGNKATPEELQTALKKLGTDGEPSNEFEYHLFTLTLLSHEIEKQAKEQNLLKTEEIEIPD